MFFGVPGDEAPETLEAMSKFAARGPDVSVGSPGTGVKGSSSDNGMSRTSNPLFLVSGSRDASAEDASLDFMAQ
jgi:hypothetical protein